MRAAAPAPPQPRLELRIGRWRARLRLVQAQTHDGRSLRVLTLIDEHSRACLALKVARRIDSLGVIEALAEAMCLHGIPGSPWENGYCENFNGKLKDECLRQEIFSSLKEAQTVIGIWQNTYNRVRPHSSLGYRPPAPVTVPDLAFRLPRVAAMP